MGVAATLSGRSIVIYVKTHFRPFSVPRALPNFGHSLSQGWRQLTYDSGPVEQARDPSVVDAAGKGRLTFVSNSRTSSGCMKS